MLALKNFLQYGVAWQGRTDDVEYMQTRAARVLLLSLADQISARNPSDGVKNGRPGLTGFTYEKSTVAAVLARFIRLGILTRQRASRHGGRHEDFATTFIAPLLIEHATEWQRACVALKKSGKRGVNARPEKAALQIPLISTLPTGESTPARLAAGERPDIGPISVQKLDTISIFTPPCLLRHWALMHLTSLQSLPALSLRCIRAYLSYLPCPPQAKRGGVMPPGVFFLSGHIFAVKIFLISEDLPPGC